MLHVLIVRGSHVSIITARSGRMVLVRAMMTLVISLMISESF